MDTTSLQVKDLSRFYHSTSIFFYRLNLTKQQVVSEILIVNDKNFLTLAVPAGVISDPTLKN